METNDDRQAREHREALLAALKLLASFYPPADRDRVRRGFLDSMEREFRAGEGVPAWFREVTEAPPM